jgi:hypothetical protein
MNGLVWIKHVFVTLLLADLLALSVSHSHAGTVYGLKTDSSQAKWTADLLEACVALGTYRYGDAFTYTIEVDQCESLQASDWPTCRATYALPVTPPYTSTPPDQLFNVSCKSEFCPSPYTLAVLDGVTVCEAYCTTGETWDPIKERCIAPPKEQSCKTQGEFPIDFIDGRKYRSEPVLSAGVRYPFSLTYFFNSHRNQEKSPVGFKVAVVNGDRYLAATKPPMTASEYQAVYTNRGAPKRGTVYREGQHYGSVDQYWRHSFDEVLLIQGNQYLYQSAKGEEIIFNGLGSSAAYPSLVLEVLASGEDAFSGYKITNRRSREVRKYYENGHLLKVERSPQDILVLTYDSLNRLDRITNSEGAYIELVYQDLVTDSVYSFTSTVHSYPVSVSNNRGESAQISWAKSYQGKIAKFHLITQITEASPGAAQSTRTFEYNDSRWPASITDQYFVADIGNNSDKQQTLHFDYDELGRAIFSGLNGGPSDAVTYVDANTRVVTNALGKKATYTFADFDGVKRLQNVTGEPTQHCVSSEVLYEYDVVV